MSETLYVAVWNALVSSQVECESFLFAFCVGTGLRAERDLRVIFGYGRRFQTLPLA
jgi:hypothetical protein